MIANLDMISLNHSQREMCCSYSTVLYCKTRNNRSYSGPFKFSMDDHDHLRDLRHKAVIHLHSVPAIRLGSLHDFYQETLVGLRHILGTMKSLAQARQSFLRGILFVRRSKNIEALSTSKNSFQRTAERVRNTSQTQEFKYFEEYSSRRRIRNLRLS